MDRQTGSLQGVYSSPIQAGEETDFWSRPLRPADQSPSPVRDGRETQPPQETTPQTTPEQVVQDQQVQAPQPDQNQQQLMELQQRLAQMEAERQNEQRQAAFREQQKKQREQRAAHRDQALLAIDQRDDLDDDQKQTLKNVVKTNFDNLNQTVDQEFQQYNSQVEGAFRQVTGPMFVAQTLQQAGLATAATWQRVQDYGITAENIQQALPALKRAAESDKQLAQTQASQANAETQQSGVTAVSGYGTSAPTGPDPEKGSHEHLEQLLVGF